MSASRNDCIDAALAELEAYGIREVERAVGGKHLQLRWRVNGGPMRMYVLPLTPGDHRAALNTRAGVRRLLREDGVLTEPAKRQPITAKVTEPTAQQRLTALERRIVDVEQRLATLETPKPRRRRKKSNELPGQVALPFDESLRR